MTLQKQGRTGGRTHLTLVLLALIYVFSFIDRNVIAIVLEPIKQEFGVSDTLMGFVSGLAFALLYAGLSLPLGRMADRGANRKNMIAFCCGLWSLATMACGTVTHFWQLLLARMSVAVGEAGGMAPSVSMVSDLYPPERRSVAMSILMLGPHLGLLAAMVAGGWIAQEWGWRAVFLFFGLPGLFLAGLLFLFSRDPGQGVFDRSEGEQVLSKQSAPSFVASFLEIIRVRAFLWVCLASGVAGLTGYGFGIWAPTFMMRQFDLSMAHSGLIFGLISGVMAALGSIGSAVVCDRLTQKDCRWQVRLPLIGVLLSLPFALAFLLWPAEQAVFLGGITVPVAVFFVAGFSFFNSWWPTLSYAAASHLMTSRQRATAAAILNLSVTLLGAGLGPLLVGVLSDVFAGYFPGEGLKYALSATLMLLLVTAAFYVLALTPYGKRIKQLNAAESRVAEAA